MLEIKKSDIARILLALTILPTLVYGYGYDCTFGNTKGPQGPSGPDRSCAAKNDDNLSNKNYRYSLCMVEKYSFSAFIQCAITSNDIELPGPEHPISPLQVLTQVLQNTEPITL